MKTLFNLEETKFDFNRPVYAIIDNYNKYKPMYFCGNETDIFEFTEVDIDVAEIAFTTFNKKSDANKMLAKIKKIYKEEGETNIDLEVIKIEINEVLEKRITIKLL